jgi:N-acetylmuramoyl-L-alanine amidase
MPFDPAFTRRLLLSHGFGAALMLPGAAHAVKPRHLAPHTGGRLKRLPLLVLDPGHGGRDPGAVGVSGTYEKHVAFATTQELARRLRQTGRYQVMMTRERDDYVALEDRVAVAHAQGASLFMSIHADALANHAVRGASVYTLAAHASDAQSAALAAHENEADRFGGAKLERVSPQVAEILASLVAHETHEGSARLQHCAVASLGHELPLLENPARHAAFAVLKSPEIPSVLVEMGFMSNVSDEAALRDVSHRAKVAAALHYAIDSYFASVDHLTHIAG